MPHNHYKQNLCKSNNQRSVNKERSAQRMCDAKVSNIEKEVGMPLGMSNRKGLSRTNQDGSRTKMRYPKVVLQGALDSFKIHKNNFPTGFQNEDVSNRKNPSLMPLQISSIAGLHSFNAEF